MAFLQKLDDASLALFNKISKEGFSKQAVFFLNAFWAEYGNQAEFIYSVHWDVIKRVDMFHRNIAYIHLYQEGNDLDFDMGLYFFEQLVKRCDSEKLAKDPQYKGSIPQMMTSIVRKKELRDKVDVNFDGRVGFLEYLLYQYNASPKDLMDRSMNEPAEDEDIRKAREALEEVNKRIAAYEAEKQRLTEQAESGATQIIKLKAVNLLAQLGASPLWEALQKALITAEAAVRIATKAAKARGGVVGGGGAAAAAGKAARTDGTIWWMNREIQEKKEKYGKKA